MNVAVVFPQVENGQDPAVIRDYAQAVEAMGYTHILAFDHVLSTAHLPIAFPGAGARSVDAMIDALGALHTKIRADVG